MRVAQQAESHQGVRQPDDETKEGECRQVNIPFLPGTAQPAIPSQPHHMSGNERDHDQENVHLAPGGRVQLVGKHLG